MTEDARLDVPVAEWNNPSTRSGGGLATISAIFPIGRNVRSEVNFRNIGAWTISVSDPIVSVFSHEPVGTAFGVAAQRVSETLTPEQVLAFPIDETVTLGEIMRGDGGVSAALLRADPDGTNADAVVREICARVSERARDLGLNQYDTAAALWAVSWSGMLSPNVARDLWAGPARDQQGSYICETIRIAVEYGLRRPQAADGTTLLTTSAAADIRDAAAAQERTIAELNRQIEALTPPPPAGRAVTDAAVIPDIATAPRPGESITAEEPEQ